MAGNQTLPFGELVEVVRDFFVDASIGSLLGDCHHILALNAYLQGLM